MAMASSMQSLARDSEGRGPRSDDDPVSETHACSRREGADLFPWTRRGPATMLLDVPACLLGPLDEMLAVLCVCRDGLKVFCPDGSCALSASWPCFPCVFALPRSFPRSPTLLRVLSLRASQSQKRKGTRSRERTMEF